MEHDVLMVFGAFLVLLCALFLFFVATGFISFGKNKSGNLKPHPNSANRLKGLQDKQRKRFRELYIPKGEPATDETKVLYFKNGEGWKR